MSHPTSTHRIAQAFGQQNQGLLTVYYTAGFPNLDDTLPILVHLQGAGVDMVEIGMPFSDPIADGETIQQSNLRALQNGMSLELLFKQLTDMRRHIHIPVLLMGYINPVLQFGIERFCQEAARVGIDGLILPDLPLYEYEQEYQALFTKYGISNVFLVTPQTSEERLHNIDRLTTGFIYAVSSASTTGKTTGISPEQERYFERLRQAKLQKPWQIGFGISDAQSFATACRYADGAIIGSAFIKALATEDLGLAERIRRFVSHIRGK
ncbi:tryptophan synthase subunit alpha [Eisenibacter elegans]|jgi:tryptophan synthase alpha chain|uniref:tryptophan synthase subunit alpha n=1 Tax=Eisenibacter elegans TaxID=997 RepID=UPI00040FBBC8|nr:tryptophan synthase subunit alpha [Eisenibacter elegans]